MEYYVALNKNRLVIHATLWVKLNRIVRSEGGQVPDSIYVTFWKKQNYGGEMKPIQTGGGERLGVRGVADCRVVYKYLLG